MIDFSGKRGVVMGIANQRSIATGIAVKLHELGAELALTYGPDPKARFEKYVRTLGKELKVSQILPVNVQETDQIETAFRTLDEAWGGLDFLVHSLAAADRADLERPFSQTSREGWSMALDISSYSLVPLARESAKLMRKNGGGSIVALTFIGSVLAVPNYGVMGPAKAALEAAVRQLARELGPENIRCNAVSAGAVRTLSSSGIKHFGEMIKVAEVHSALQRLVSVEEVAHTVAFLCSSASSGITGQSVYVECGFNVMAN